MIYKSTFKFLTPKILLLSAVLFFGSFFFTSAHEQLPTNYCSIEDVLSVDYISPLVLSEQTDELAGQVLVSNSSEVLMPGVSIAVAVYKDNDVIPEYWTTVAESMTLKAGGSRSIPIIVDVSSLPKGTYSYKLFIGQGDFVSQFGRAVLAGANNSEQFSKNTPEKPSLTIDLQVNDDSILDAFTIPSGELFSAQTVVKRDGGTNLLEGNISLVLTSQDVPLGTAVEARVEDEVKFIPNGSRSIALTDYPVMGGAYTFYVLVTTPNILQPVTSVFINEIGEKNNQKFTFLEAVGITEYPFKSSSYVVSCFGQFGDENVLFETPQEVAVTMNFTSNQGVDLGSRLVQQERSKRQAVLYTNVADLPQNMTGNVVMHHNTYVDGPGEVPSEQSIRNDWKQTDKISFSVDCEEIDHCVEVENSDTSTQNTYKNSYDTQKPHWIYYGVTISALLLLLLVARRLRTGKEEKENNEVMSNELQ